tara:strand:- start:250 stop:474 length:225 start_codon:yes stop_codon:yes gene_type:complete
MSEVEIRLDQAQFNELESAVNCHGDRIADAIRSIAEVDGGSGNAFIGIAQGLFSIAEAIEKHTQYLKDRDSGRI